MYVSEKQTLLVKPSSFRFACHESYLSLLTSSGGEFDLVHETAKGMVWQVGQEGLISHSQDTGLDSRGGGNPLKV